MAHKRKSFTGPRSQKGTITINKSLYKKDSVSLDKFQYCDNLGAVFGLCDRLSY